MNNSPVSFFGNKPGCCTVRQVSADPGGATLIYPDQPSFLHGGRRLIYNSASGPMVCDLETLQSQPLFADGRKHAVHLSPGGRFVFWQERPEAEKNAFGIWRRSVDGGDIAQVFQVSEFLPGTEVRGGAFHLHTVSLDNQRGAGSAWLGDGSQADAPIGVVSIDFERGQACVAASATDFINTHLQYCRSTDPEAGHDLLVQMNHGAHTDATGKVLVHLGPPAEGGCDVHVVRDDGTHWRDLPWGRDGRESCIGHQVWRGRSREAVTVTLQNQDRSYGWADSARQEVVAGTPVPAKQDRPHRGRTGRAAHRTCLSRGFSKPRFCHLCCDDSGLQFVCDTFPVYDGKRAGMRIFAGRAPDMKSPAAFRLLLNSCITFNANNGYHAHPIISPDGRAILFNSDVTGKRQVYLVTDF
jgi:hypothetical protein